MKVIYKSQFQKICFDPVQKCMEQKWFDETKNMKTEQYCQEQLILLNYILELLPLYFLVDTQKLNFIISAELQTWTNENLNYTAQKILGKNRKYAFVVSKDFFTQLSVESVFDETSEGKSEYIDPQNFRYFEDKTQAKQWLLK